MNSKSLVLLTIPITTVGGGVAGIAVAAVAAVTGVISLVADAREEKKRAEEARKRAEEAEEARKKAEEARKKAEEVKKRAEEVRKKAEEAEERWFQGIPPDVRPSEEQITKAKSMLEDPRGIFCHLAVAGYTGAGKSSLVNALRGCEDDHESAAQVGIVETTMNITRYPDRGSIFERFVWYDVPGAGTQAHRGWQYFNDNGLFVFDTIIICLKDRISEIDIQILNNCEKYNIPTFLVRTNSETQVSNLKRSRKISEKEAIKELIKMTCASVKKNLVDSKYSNPDKKVYIIDRYILGAIVSNLTEKLQYCNNLEVALRESTAGVKGIINECDLLIDLLQTKKQRRY